MKYQAKSTMKKNTWKWNWKSFTKVKSFEVLGKQPKKETNKFLQKISLFLLFNFTKNSLETFPLFSFIAWKLFPTFAFLNLHTHQRVWRNQNVSQVCLSAFKDFLSLATMFFWLFRMSCVWSTDTQKNCCENTAKQIHLSIFKYTQRKFVDARRSF